jgi:hypothetical protein
MADKMKTKPRTFTEEVRRRPITLLSNDNEDKLVWNGEVSAILEKNAGRRQLSLYETIANRDYLYSLEVGYLGYPRYIAPIGLPSASFRSSVREKEHSSVVTLTKLTGSEVDYVPLEDLVEISRRIGGNSKQQHFITMDDDRTIRVGVMKEAEALLPTVSKGLLRS